MLLFMGFSISLLDLSRVLEHQGQKEQASSQRKGGSPENAGPYLCYCTVFTPALAFIRAQERMGDAPFPTNSEKSNLKH